MRPWLRVCLVIGTAALGLATSTAHSQVTLDFPRSQYMEYGVDSGVQGDPAAGAPGLQRVVWTHVVDIPAAKWLRLHFGPETLLAEGSAIRVTSLLDDEVHELTRRSLDHWNLSTAYFNGQAVRVDLISGAAPAGPEEDRVVIDRIELQLGRLNPGGESCGICATDTREPSDMPWACRLLPAGCSAAVYNDESCLVSAGHCMGGDMVVQFRVPPSGSDCELNHPPVIEQFPIMERQLHNNGVGDDWAAMRSGENTAGETILERYGVFMPISATPARAGDPVNVSGYGVDNQCVRNQVQQTDTDPGEITVVGTQSLRYTTDATFGNSGSSVIRNGVEIVGIATHCPCPNIATRMDQEEFVAGRERICGQEGIQNDNCDEAPSIGNGNVPFSTLGATTDGPPLPVECDEGNGRHMRKDIWYRYTAQCTGTATATTCNSDFDTWIAIYTGEACPGAFVECADDRCGDEGTRAEATFFVTQGESYLVRIGSIDETGEGTLTMSCVDGPACPGDIDGDGEVGFGDLVQVLSVWGPYGDCPPYMDEDLDQDCMVAFSDIVAILAAWGECP